MADVNMHVTHEIPLDISASEMPSVVFLRAKINARHLSPFALVSYAISGNERPKALRLDLDKRRFIDLADNIEGSDFHHLTNMLTPLIVRRITLEMTKWYASAAVS